MIWLLTIAGAAGAGVLYALDTSPALGARHKNAAGILAAVLIGLALWQAGVANAWALPVAWCECFLVLWASTYQVGADDLIWVRAATSTGLAVLMSSFFA